MLREGYFRRVAGAMALRRGTGVRIDLGFLAMTVWPMVSHHAIPAKINAGALTDQVAVFFRNNLNSTFMGFTFIGLTIGVPGDI